MKRVEHVMGTVVSITVVNGTAAEQAIRRAIALMHQVDHTFSLWKPDSAIWRQRRGQDISTPEQVQLTEVELLCRQAKAMSAGWFDPWSMSKGYDPTGMVKGWACERALEDMKMSNASVNAGGDIAVCGNPEPGRTWLFGIQHPGQSDQLLCTAALPSGIALATSGTYQRGDHIISPMTKAPSSAVSSASVIGPSLALADAFATAIIAGGVEVAQLISDLDGYEVAVYDWSGQLLVSEGFPLMQPAAAHAEVSSHQL